MRHGNYWKSDNSCNLWRTCIRKVVYILSSWSIYSLTLKLLQIKYIIKIQCASASNMRDLMLNEDFNKII